MPRGRVKYYQEGTGLGMIEPDAAGEDVSFSRAVVVGSVSILTTGLPVEYEAHQGVNGPEADRVVPR